MELRTLRYFLAVAREENITRASEQLHLTQPNLSRQLKELEEELGTALFLRGGRKITLTEEGHILRKRAEEMVELEEKTRTEIASSVEQVTGDLWIGCAETDAMRLLIRAMKALREIHPDIRLHITSGNAEVVGERLERGLLDFGLFIEPCNLHNYDYIRLPITDIWGLLMRKDSPLAEKRSVTSKDLSGPPLICSHQDLARNGLAGWTGGGYDRLSVVATYNLLYNASLMVEEGIGYALTLDKIIPITKDRPLCFRPLEPRLEAGISIAWKKYQMPSKAAGVFLEQLQRDISAVHESQNKE